mgnify:CR=1 FL=1
MIDSSILHQFHLFLIIKNQRVIILAHEEMLHLPMFFFYLLGQFLTVIYRQREDNTTFLQLSVSCKIKHKIIKKLVSRLWHRSLLYQLFCRVHRLSVGNHRVGWSRINGRRRLLICASHRRETNDGSTAINTVNKQSFFINLLNFSNFPCKSTTFFWIISSFKQKMLSLQSKKIKI